jgi:hypothetical protein
MLSESTTVLAVIDHFFQVSPYSAAAITCGIKASAADFVAQKRDYRKRKEQAKIDQTPKPKRKNTDYQRNLAFILYGSLYQGMAQGKHLFCLVAALCEC